jgi:hypothetical protein
MKKLGLLAALIATAAVVSSVAVGGALGTGPPVVTQVDCTVLDANGGGIATTGTLTAYSNGKVTLHCIGQGAGNGSVVTWNNGNTGASCGIGQYGSTTDWNDRVSKSGESQLWCYGSTGPAPPISSTTSGIG